MTGRVIASVLSGLLVVPAPGAALGRLSAPRVIAPAAARVLAPAVLPAPIKPGLNILSGADIPLTSIAAPTRAPSPVLAETALAAEAPETAQSLFDGLPTRGPGYLPEDTAPSIPLDAKPQLPAETDASEISFDRTQLLAAEPQEPVVLPGNPRDADAVAEALRAHIARHPGLFGAIPADALQAKFATKVAGQAGLEDAVYVSFGQSIGGVPVEGAHADFTVKLRAGHAVVARAAVRLFPKLPADVAPRLSEGQIAARASERLAEPAGTLRDLGLRVMHLDRQWRTVSLRRSETTALLAAVDVKTGASFAWDPRFLLRAETSHPPSGISGRLVEDGSMPGAALKELPLGHIAIRSQGETYYADGNGEFTVKGEGSDPVPVTIRLEGRYARVFDRSGSSDKGLSVTMKARPGEKLRAVFNPQGADENAVAQLNAYYHVTRQREWLRQAGIELRDLDTPLTVFVNRFDMECQAYYDPFNPTLNFFASGKRCVNTAFNDIILHEYGHRVDDAAGGILNLGLSEGWGDIMTLFITGQPNSGRGFFKADPSGHVRDGDNDYQYGPQDEAHKQGLAWMGFAWKLRRALVASLGAAQGAALATALVIPVLLSGARDIPQAVQAVLLRDTGADGVAPHYREISEAARAHGIDVGPGKDPRG